MCRKLSTCLNKVVFILFDLFSEYLATWHVHSCMYLCTRAHTHTHTHTHTLSVFLCLFLCLCLSLSVRLLSLSLSLSLSHTHTHTHTHTLSVSLCLSMSLSLSLPLCLALSPLAVLFDGWTFTPETQLCSLSHSLRVGLTFRENESFRIWRAS